VRQSEILEVSVEFGGFGYRRGFPMDIEESVVLLLRAVNYAARQTQFMGCVALGRGLF